MAALDGTLGIVFPDATVQGTGAENGLKPILAAVASNALTVTLSPTPLQFRSATLGSGAVTASTILTAVSLVVPSTATLGTVSAIQSRLILLAINNAGTVELAIVNIAGGNNLDETTLISTTALSASATSASVIYSTTARTGVAFRVVGYVESTQATAGTWATAPSTVQGMGGNALAAMSSLGYGQTWQIVTGSRVAGTTYYNSTGKPIGVKLNVSTGTNTGPAWTINGVTLASVTGAGGQQQTVDAVVPVMASYSGSAGSGGTISQWAELR